MKVSFEIDNADVRGNDWMAELRSIAKTYYRDDVEISFSVDEIPDLDDGCPTSGTFHRFEDGTDEFVFD